MESPLKNLDHFPAARRRLGAALCAASLAALAGATAFSALASTTGAAVADVLDLPAAPSTLALKRPLSGIAVQGSTALAVGVRGTILVSPDAGKGWKQASVPVSTDLTTVRFTSPGVAWALGHDGVVLRSGDSGRTWIRVLDGRSLAVLMKKHYQPLAAGGNAGATEVLAELERAMRQSATPGVLPYPFLDIRIGADGEGFLAGAFGLLLRTMDAGKTWEPMLEKAANDRRMHLYALEQGADGAVYLAGEQGLLARYDRASGRFAALASPYAGTFFGLKANGSALVAYGLRGNAFLSEDNAATWKPLALGGAATVVAAIPAGPGQFAFVTQAGQVVLPGTDGTTTRAATRARGEVFDAALSAPGQLVVAGTGGVTLQPMPSK
ncbi:MAG: glycosyl hydrolase [Massilia sp.]|nr:glycosyl hydrolase [Massilia sp.]